MSCRSCNADPGDGVATGDERRALAVAIFSDAEHGERALTLEKSGCRVFLSGCHPDQRWMGPHQLHMEAIAYCACGSRSSKTMNRTHSVFLFPSCRWSSRNPSTASRNPSRSRHDVVAAPVHKTMVYESSHFYGAMIEKMCCDATCLDLNSTYKLFEGKYELDIHV